MHPISSADKKNIISLASNKSSIQRVLKKHSLKAVTKKKKPLLTVRHRKLRLAFALKDQNWTEEDWQRVFQSDETKINRIGSDGKQWVWKEVGQGLIQRC